MKGERLKAKGNKVKGERSRDKDGNPNNVMDD